MASIPLMYAQEDCELGGKESIQNDFAYRNNVANADKEIRLGFIRKVYGLLSIQLLATVTIASVFMFVEPVKGFIHQNDWMVFVAFIMSMVTLVALVVKRRDYPTNLYLLTGFTVVQAYTLGVVVSFYNTWVVLQALALTLTVVFSLTLYTLNTKRDFSFIGYGLVAGCCVLLIGGLLQIFIQSSAFEVALSFTGTILFSFFLIFDTQQMMKVLSPEEYILATINLYMDIINLFLYILPPTAFVAHGVAKGKRVTSYPSTKEKIPAEYTYVEGERVVVDGNIVTSRGPGTAYWFGLKLIELLTGKEKADQVEKGMIITGY